MKDWEIAGAYYLPRILRWRTRNKTLPSKLPKPNLRYISLSEDAQWTLWRSSGYFYPEMIPEPDYSDSGDEAGSEDEDKQQQRFAPNPRPALERLRDLTEVYVSNVNTNKKTQAKKTSLVKQAEPTSKTAAPKQTPKSALKSPPKPPAKKQSNSPTDVSSSSTVAKRPAKSPERAPKDAAKSPSKATGDSKQATAATKTKLAPSVTVAKAAEGRKASPKAAGGDAKSKSDSDKTSSGRSSEAEQSSDEDQLIKPKKPYVPSSEKQKLHQELKFSQKYGKLVPSKTELQLALERYTENKVKRELDAEEKSSLEKILEHQAKKIEMQEIMDKNPAWLDRLQKPPSTWPNPKTEEFYRVHARVVSSNILTHCFLLDDDGPQREYSSLPCNTLSHSDSDS